jgi:hypothetical protein
LLILELTLANVDDVLQRLATLERDDRQARAVVVAGRELAMLEWIVMEAGALALITSSRQSRLLVAIVARFFAERPVDERPAAERIWSRLPWRKSVNSGQRRLAVTSTAQVQPE